MIKIKSLSVQCILIKMSTSDYDERMNSFNFCKRSKVKVILGKYRNNLMDIIESKLLSVI